MNYRLVGKYMGYIMLVEGIFMIPAVLVALYFGEPATVRALLISICAALLPLFIKYFGY